jgi:protein SCO1/2
MRAALALALGILASLTLVKAHEAADEQRLPTVGAAPDFILTSQDGAAVTLADIRGRLFGRHDWRSLNELGHEL